MGSEAEKALQRKYELLRQKKLKQQQQASGSKPSTAAAPGLKVDATRQAAIEALKAKRAAEAGGTPQVAKPTTAAAAREKPTGEEKSFKLKFIIPKKPAAEDAAAASALGAEPAISKPAAAAAATAAPAAEAKPHPPQKPSTKRPALKRPPLRPAAAEEEAKRQRGQEAAGVPSHEQDIPSIPELFVGDLPEHYDSDMLWEFFSQFHEVVDAQVVGRCCYGFVTFASFEDAESLLHFQSQQPVLVEDRQLRISWSKRGMDQGGGWQGGAVSGGGGSGGGEAPRMTAAREAAAAVAEQIDQHELAMVNLNGPPPTRTLVTYDDL